MPLVPFFNHLRKKENRLFCAAITYKYIQLKQAKVPQSVVL